LGKARDLAFRLLGPLAPETDVEADSSRGHIASGIAPLD
jgi:hypothetical protein